MTILYVSVDVALEHLDVATATTAASRKAAGRYGNEEVTRHARQRRREPLVSKRHVRLESVLISVAAIGANLPIPLFPKRSLLAGLS